MNFHSPVLPDFSDTFNIKTNIIARGHSCYIIAEAGSNHDRDIDKALALIDAAADSGCNAIKFQSFSGEDIASNYQCKYTELSPEYKKWGNNLQELYKNCSLPDDFYEPLFEYAKERDIHFLSSPFSEQAVDRLAQIGVPALKIASFELVHLPLIEYAANTGIPLILSTGMAGLGDIERALESADKGGAKNVALLHCGSNYPLGPEGANLTAMQTLRKAFGVPVGYSDHTLGTAVPISVAALGGDILEKHITISRISNGPDHGFAIEPHELKQMVKEMRIAELATGSSKKTRQRQENVHAIRGRRSLFSSCDIKAGDRLNYDNCKVVRPGIGIEPMFLELLLGRKIIRDIPPDHPLHWDDFINNEAD